MTALRPEREGTDLYGGGGAGGYAYEDTGQFAAAVEQLDDPLTDPLPGRRRAAGPGTDGGDSRPPGPARPPGPVAAAGPAPGTGTADAGASAAPADPPGPGYPSVPADPSAPAGPVRSQGSPWFRAQTAGPVLEPGPPPRPSPFPSPSPSPAQEYVRPQARPGPPRQDHDPAPGHVPPGPVRPEPPAGPLASPVPPAPAPAPEAFPPGPETFPAPDPAPGPGSGPDPGSGSRPAPEAGTDPSSPPSGGRAARRRAAQEQARRKRRGGGHGRRARPPAAGAVSTAAGAADRAPASRVEARRAARAARDSPGVVASRIVGEVFITFGVLMLLFVAYQLWWTNVLAHQAADGAAKNLEQEWEDAKGGKRAPGAFEPGQGFAIMYIPKLDVKVPIAEGIDKHKVLDKGMIGHYAGELETAMPWDKKGNFAVAGHRNTHGEPFRYINKLQPGDAIVVETESMYYTYEMTSVLPQTAPSDIGVIGPVPPGSGFTGPGRYITLTTCTPEFTSKYRLIVWGKLAEERPRSKGKPDALVG